MGERAGRQTPRTERELLRRYPIVTLTPAERPRPGAPWIALATALIASLVLPAMGRTLGAGWLLRGFSRVLAAIAVCWVADWVEDRFYTALSGRPRGVRLLVALAVPSAALGAGVFGFAPLYRLSLFLDDGDALAVTVLLGLGWVASAGVGSLLIVLLDLAISSLYRDLRRRITLAVLGLVVGVTAFALQLVQNGPGWIYRAAQTLQEHAGRAHLADADLSRLTSPGAQRQFTFYFFIAAALAAVPAVLSACAKLADAVMERLHPLALGFDAVARGRLNVRVEVAGSSDFIALNHRFNQMVESLAQAQRMESAFGQYVSPHVMELIRRQHGEAAIAASMKQATVFFADIRGFTSLSEKLAPAQVLEVLNRYFERAVPVVEEHEGYLDKFVGDAMVVVFNGPLEQPDHAERAVRCAIELQREVAALNELGAFPEVQGDLAIGIGIATGALVTGNLGSARKREFTVVGDTVNLASRLTSHAGAGEVLINEGNATQLSAELPRFLLGPVKFKGKEQAVLTYRVWPRTVAAEVASGDTHDAGQRIISEGAAATVRAV